MTKDELQMHFIGQLKDRQAPAALVKSAIANLEIGYVERALEPLLSLVIDQTRQLFLRKEAARAISVIGASPIAAHVRTLMQTSDSETAELLRICIS